MEREYGDNNVTEEKNAVNIIALFSNANGGSWKMVSQPLQ